MLEEKLKELDALQVLVATEAATFIRNIMSSPYYDAYITLKYTLDMWNREIKENSIEMTDETESKSFDRTLKYLKEMDSFYKQLDTIRTHLMPKEIKSANEEVVSLFERAQIELKEKELKKQK